MLTPSSVIKQRPNRKIFGTIKFHLGVYNLVDKIKLEARMESNNAIIRAADSHIARVIKKLI